MEVLAVDTKVVVAAAIQGVLANSPFHLSITKLKFISMEHLLQKQRSTFSKRRIWRHEKVMEMVIIKRRAKHLTNDKKGIIGTETLLIKIEMIETGLMKIRRIVDLRRKRVDTITTPCTRISWLLQSLYKRYSIQLKERIRIFYLLYV